MSEGWSSGCIRANCKPPPDWESLQGCRRAREIPHEGDTPIAWKALSLMNVAASPYAEAIEFRLRGRVLWNRRPARGRLGFRAVAAFDSGKPSIVPWLFQEHALRSLCPIVHGRGARATELATPPSAKINVDLWTRPMN